MPLHDWTRVTPGTFHDFHLAWIAHLKEILNEGLLQAGYCAMAEQWAGKIVPDMLTLSCTDGETPSSDRLEPPAGAIAVAQRVPKASRIMEADLAHATLKRRTLVIRHATGDRVVALIEIVSPGNKTSRLELSRFVNKVFAALQSGCHVLLIDLFPPGPLDPDGLHGVLWPAIQNDPFLLPVDHPLTVASYCAGPVVKAYIEPLAAGMPLPDMPLFLDPEFYIDVPLEATYQQAWRGVPQRWRQVIETPPEPH